MAYRTLAMKDGQVRLVNDSSTYQVEEVDDDDEDDIHIVHHNGISPYTIIHLNSVSNFTVQRGTFVEQGIYQSDWTDPSTHHYIL